MYMLCGFSNNDAKPSRMILLAMVYPVQRILCTFFPVLSPCSYMLPQACSQSQSAECGYVHDNIQLQTQHAGGPRTNKRVCGIAEAPQQQDYQGCSHSAMCVHVCK